MTDRISPGASGPATKRLAATRNVIQRELSRGRLIYRKSGMAGEERTFLAYANGMVEASALLGEQDAARRQMVALSSMMDGNFGLLPEEIDPVNGTMRGNLPQVLSHLAMIHAALSLNEGRG